MRDLEVFLDTTNSCNLRCVTCVFSDPRVATLPKYTMPWSLYERIAEQVFPRADYLALSCLAEPLVNRGLPRVLRHAGQFEVPHTELVTNAMLLRDEHLTAMVEARLWRLAVSVDGGDAQAYEQVRRGASWQRLDANLMRAREHFARSAHRPELRVIVTLVKDNLHGAVAAVDHAARWGATEVELRETIVFPGIGLEQRQLDGDIGELDRLTAECAARATTLGMSLLVLRRHRGEGPAPPGTPPCHALERRLAIAPNGDAMPCMLWAREPLGSFCRQSFNEIWNGAVRERFRRELEAAGTPLWCPSCTFCKDDPSDDDAYYRLLAKPRCPPPQ